MFNEVIIILGRFVEKKTLLDLVEEEKLKIKWGQVVW